MTLLTDLSNSTMNPPQMPPFSPEPLPPQLPAPEPAPLPPLSLMTTGGGRVVDALGFEWSRINPFLLPLLSGGRGHEETRQKGSLLQEYMADTGPPHRRELSTETGLAEALFEFFTLKKEEWGGIWSGKALLLQEAGPPRSIISQWGIDIWKQQPRDPLNLIIWGRSQTKPWDILRHGDGANSDSGGCCCRGGDQETRAVNETAPVETCDLDGEILETSGLAVLIAPEKRRILS